MKMHSVPLTAWLLDDLLRDPAADSLRDPANAAVFRQRALDGLERAGIVAAWAMLDGDSVLAAFGIVPHWHGRAEGWMVLSAKASPRARVMASREASRRMDELQRNAAYRRIEMWLCAAESWAPSFGAALGMRCETPAGSKAWDPLGRTYLLYARVAGETG